MEHRIDKQFKIVRVLDDGESVPVSSLESLDEARRLIASLNEYWPGHYSVLPLETKAKAR